MSFSERSRDRLVGLIYQAALEPCGWRRFIDEMDNVLEGVYLSFYGHDTITGCPVDVITTRYPHEHVKNYVSYYNEINPFIKPIADAPAMLIQRSERWVAERELMKTEFYADFLRPMEDAFTGGGGAILNEDGAVMIMSGQVRRRDGDDKADQLIETVRFLAPHLRRAFQIRRALAGASIKSQQFLEKIPGAALIIDGDSRIMSKNCEADALLKDGHVCRINTMGELRLWDLKADSALRAEIRRMRSGALPVPFSRLARSEGGQPYLLTLAPLGEELDSHDPFTRFSGQRRALVVLRGPKDPDAAGIAALEDAFDLSPSESALATALFRGFVLNEYAHSKGVSIHTVRNQLKSLLRKTGACGQVKLLHIVRHFLA